LTYSAHLVKLEGIVCIPKKIARVVKPNLYLTYPWHRPGTERRGGIFRSAGRKII